MSAPILITADEVNCLVYSYLQDSGFQHSAFAVRVEGRLENSPHFAKHIPRGELVELLSKALLYIEVESHWKGDSMTANCKTGFSLLEPHVCSLDSKAPLKLKPPPPSRSMSAVPAKIVSETNGSADAGAKRKASTPSTSTDDGRAEKRPRRETEDMDVDDLKPIPPLSMFAPPTSNGSKSTKPSNEPGDKDNNSEAVQLLRGHKSEIFVCAWNKAFPGLLATGSKDGIVHIWDVPDPSKAGSSTYSGPLITANFRGADNPTAEGVDLTSLDWNPDGSLLAVGSYDSVLRIIRPSGELYFSHPQHKGPIFATRFSKSGRWLLTGSLDGTSCVWDVKDKKLHLQYRAHRDCCLDVEWLDDSTFASCGADSNIHIMNVDDTKLMKTLTGHYHEVNQIRCNPARTRLASCSDDTTARIWNIADISSRSPDSIPGLVASDNTVVLKGHTQSVSSIGWCPYPFGPNELVATCAFDGCARMWDSVTGACLKHFGDHTKPVYALSFSPNGRLFATGGGDGYLHVYNVEAKEKKWSWFVGTEKPGVFELDWQGSGNINRIAVALEGWNAGVVNVRRVPALQNAL